MAADHIDQDLNSDRNYDDDHYYYLDYSSRKQLIEYLSQHKDNEDAIALKDQIESNLHQLQLHFNSLLLLDKDKALLYKRFTQLMRRLNNSQNIA